MKKLSYSSQPTDGCNAVYCRNRISELSCSVVSKGRGWIDDAEDGDSDTTNKNARRRSKQGSFQIFAHTYLLLGSPMRIVTKSVVENNEIIGSVPT